MYCTFNTEKQNPGSLTGDEGDERPLLRIHGGSTNLPKLELNKKYFRETVQRKDKTYEKKTENNYGRIIYNHRSDYRPRDFFSL